MLVDSHCHIDDFSCLRNLHDIIKYAQRNSTHILQIISTGTRVLENILSTTGRYDNIFCSIGTHPLYLTLNNEINYQDIIKQCNHKKITAIGETGLDYSIKNVDILYQQKNFIEHIKVAQKTNLPIIIHSRNAMRDTINILNKYMQKKSFTGVLHSFTGSTELAFASLRLGLYISASGIITFKGVNSIRDTFIESIPINRILLETDSPYLSPIPMRGRNNHPGYLIYVSRIMSQLMKMEYQQFCQQTTKNYFSLFRKTASIYNKRIC